MTILEEFKKIKDENYKNFSTKIIPTNQEILGVRLPAIRKIAKNIAKTDISDFIEEDKGNIYEMIMVEGLVLSYVKSPFIELIPLIENFLEKVDNWAQIDSVIMSFKNIDDKKLLLKTAQKWIKSEKEFVVRAGIILVLSNLVEKEYLDVVFEISNNINHKGYYVFMGNAWLISVCMAKFPNETMEYFKNNKLDIKTQNKAIQKSCESFRVTKANKELIKKLKR